MNIYSIIPTIAFLFNGFVWTYIYAQKKQNSINRAFLIYASVLAFWILLVIIERQPIPSYLVMPIKRTASISWLSIAFLFMNFTYVFIKRKRDLFFYTCLIIIFVSIIISVPTRLVLKDFEYVNWGVNKIVGPLFLPLVIVAVIVPGTYSLFLIWREKNKTTDFNLKHSLPLLLLGSLITLIIGLISNVVIPLFFHIQRFVEFAESGTVIQSLFIFRAVMKYKLFSVGFEEAAKDIFTNLQDGVIIIDNQGNITQMNAAAKEILDLNFREWDKIHISFILEDFYKMPDSRFIEKEISVDGKSKTIFLTRVQIIEDELEIGKLLIIKDITERKLADNAIRKSEIKFRSVWENSTDAMRLTDENGIIITANKAYCRLVGMNEKELIGEPLTITYSGSKDRSVMLNNYKKGFKEQNFPQHLEQKLILKNNKTLFIEASNSFIKLEDQKFLLLGIFRDITERLVAQKKNTMLGHTITSMKECVTITDLENKIISVNPSFLKTYGYSEEEIIGRNVDVIRSSQNSDHINEEIMSEILKEGWHGELINVRKNGEEFPIILSASVVRDETGKPVALVGISRDITEQKELQTKLQEAAQQRIEDLHRFNVSLQRAQEDERTKIAREIHDELGQVLTALKMDIVLLTEGIKDGIKTAKENIITELNSISKMIDGSIHLVRNIATELRPDILDHLGLIAAIKWQAKEFEKRNRIKCFFESDVDFIELEKNKSTSIFRIFQEILTNILRHSDSTEVRISINKINGSFILKVKDNGKGINPNKIDNINSIGLIGMKERSELIGGKIDIAGEKNKGTCVTLEIPLLNEKLKLELN